MDNKKTKFIFHSLNPILKIISVKDGDIIAWGKAIYILREKSDNLSENDEDEMEDEESINSGYYYDYDSDNSFC